ncbi:MAG TPA: DUF4082 domain-containing protein, partial [Candidatus Saccharimonadales bacterium]|nr:DUF4082 domain-containing protein [Candidatus Saccharimonadales bacterium]
MAVAKRPIVRSNSRPKKKQSWLGRTLSGTYAKPAIVVLVFMVIGGGSAFLAMAATTTSSLWSTSTLPKTIDSGENGSIELGVRFKSNVAGYVTGVRFYKSALNKGTHTGSLWDKSGKLLASVTFTGESASGWQTANFAQPVSVASGTVYTISYHAPQGHFSINNNYFNKMALTNGHLTALRERSGQPNGVFTYTAGTSYPAQNGDGDNFWVDVLFSTSLLNSQPAPAAPTGVVATAQSSTSVSVSWQASVSDSPIAHYMVYRNGTKLADVGTATTYTDSTAIASTTYNYQVLGMDSNGLSSVLSQSASVTTPASTTTGGGTGSGGTGTGTGPGSTSGGNTGSACPLPKYPDATCTGVPAGTSLTVVSGDMNISTANTVVDSKDIRGCIDVTA